MECRRGLAMRILFLRLPVRRSDKRVICDKTKESCARILIPHKIFTLFLGE